MQTEWYTKYSYSQIEDRDCVEYHMMSYEDAEIIGQFCDYYAIHGDDLVEVLTLGLRKWREKLDTN